MERITTNNFYKYAPETVRVFVNGQEINTDGTNIRTDIATGHKEEATKEIKRAYRRQNATESNYIYAFFVEGTKKFYYLPQLCFKASASIDERLRIYKESKAYFKENPAPIIIETGNPYESKKPEEKKEMKIDFTRTTKYKINFK